MNLGQDATPGTIINNGKVSAKQLGWELAGLCRIITWLELGVGVMLNSVKSGVDININNSTGGTTNKNKELSETWGDVLLVARIQNKPAKNLFTSFVVM